jgi:hypothetical protein
MSRKPRLLAIGLLMLALVVGNVPQAGANASVAAGEIAVVATTEGDLLSLREGPGLGFAVMIGLGAGTEVEILDGPIYADVAHPAGGRRRVRGRGGLAAR